MYNEYISEIKDDIKQFRKYTEILEYLYRKLDYLERADKQLSDFIAEYQQTGERATEVVSGEAVEILKKYALQAIRDTKEFDLHEFRSRLINAIEDPRTIKIIWNPRTQNVTIDIDLDKTAGGLADYERGIDITRRRLKIGPYKPFPLDPLDASLMWSEKYYKPAREGTEIPQPKDTGKKKHKKARKYNVAKYINAYKRTIRTRLASFRRLAPYWRIINYGTQPLDSDWGGEAYPFFGPTHFVEKAKKVISRRIAEQLVGTKDTPGANDSIARLQNNRRQMQKAMQYINTTIRQVEIRAFESPTKQKATPQLFGINEIKRRLGDQFTDASIREITDLVNGLIEGTTDPKQKKTLHFKTGGSKRIRVKQLFNDLQQYRNS